MFDRAFFHIASSRLFWACLFAILVTAMIPRFVITVFNQYFWPSDVQISKEMEKYGSSSETARSVEMIPVSSSPRAMMR